MRGLDKSKLKALGKEYEHVQKSRRKDDVIIDGEQPVMALDGMIDKQLVQVFELAARTGGGGRKRHLMMGAAELGMRRGQHVRHIGPLNRERQHPPGRPLSRCVPEPERLQDRQPLCVFACVREHR
jgi:hypothetical protein